MYSKSYSLPTDLIESLHDDRKLNKVDEHTLNHFQLSRHSRVLLNKHLLQYNLRYEYAILFRWHPGSIQPLHVDGAPPGKPRNASLNLILRGGEGSTIEWYNAQLADEALVSTSGIEAFKTRYDTARLVHREPLQECSVIKTNVPHRVTNIVTNTELLCLRMQGNPTIDKF